MVEEERPSPAGRIGNALRFGRSRRGQAEEAEATDVVEEDAEPVGAEERPKIADKVRFWEEQDRINRELIPRVLKQHDLFTAHIETHDSAAALMAEMEARLTERVRERTAELEVRFTSAAAESQRQALETASQAAAAAVKSAKRQSLIVASISIIVAVVAVVLAVVL
jgi:hypothetical protein